VRLAEVVTCDTLATQQIGCLGSRDIINATSSGSLQRRRRQWGLMEK
jgi:hypothetical protein